VPFAAVVGTTYRLKGVVSGSTASVWVNSTLEKTATLTDGTTTGRIALGTEVAHVHFDNVFVSTP